MSQDIADSRANGVVSTNAPSWVLFNQALVAGWISGGAGIIVGHPFDTVKTLQQTTKSQVTPQASRVLRDVWRQYGLAGLYRGLAYPLITYGAVNSAFFAAAEHTRSLMYIQGHVAEGDRLSTSQVFFVGAMGGVAQLSVVCPSELIKIKLQAQLESGKRLYRGPTDCTIKLWRQSGDYLMDDGMNYIMAELIGGGAAGAASWGVATPFDVVKTRIQASERRRHVWLTIKELYQEGGWRVFTRGIGVSMFRGIPSNAVTLCGFSELMRWADWYNTKRYG